MKSDINGICSQLCPLCTFFGALTHTHHNDPPTVPTMHQAPSTIHHTGSPFFLNYKRTCFPDIFWRLANPPHPCHPPPSLAKKFSFFSNKAPPFSEKISSWPKDAKNTPFWPKYQKNPETNRFFSDRGDPEFTTPPPPLGQKFWIKLSFSVKLNSSE